MAKIVAPVNYSTTVDSGKTITEISSMLFTRGVTRLMTEVEDARPVALTFEIPGPRGPMSYRLPVDVKAMQRLLAEGHRQGVIHGTKAKMTSLDQAERVAWRVIKTWLAAQFALVDTQMVQTDEVLLPYLLISPTETVYGAYLKNTLALV